MSLIRWDCACEVLFACLPLPVMESFLLMAGGQDAKPILQYLMAALQILCCPCSARKPLCFLPSSKHAFNQLLDLVLKSSLRHLLMMVTKRYIPYIKRQMIVPHVVEVVCRAIILFPHTLAITRGGRGEMVEHSPDDI